MESSTPRRRELIRVELNALVDRAQASFDANGGPFRGCKGSTRASTPCAWIFQNVHNLTARLFKPGKNSRHHFGLAMSEPIVANARDRNQLDAVRVGRPKSFRAIEGRNVISRSLKDQHGHMAISHGFDA
jgi:hypothetical protein